MQPLCSVFLGVLATQRISLSRHESANILRYLNLGFRSRSTIMLSILKKKFCRGKFSLQKYFFMTLRK